MSWSSQDFFAKYDQAGLVREKAIIKEVLSGNTPENLFAFVPVIIGGDIVEVMPDYLAIGTDADYVRVPMTPYGAQFIANYYGLSSPTPNTVDRIWAAAERKLIPITKDWNYVPPITGTNGLRFREHSKLIDDQLHHLPFGSNLVAGHKKDVVSDERLMKQHPHHVVIYGWQQSGGHNIQPETAVHDWNYADYSHGIRFVRDPSGRHSGKCCLDELPWDIKSLGDSHAL